MIGERFCEVRFIAVWTRCIIMHWTKGVPATLMAACNRPELKTMHILLVEDDLRLAAFMIKGFKSAGFAVDHAPDGEYGLQMALQQTYDAAIVDIMMPKLDGLALIQELRRRKKSTIPIIILSAKRKLDDRIKGLQTGSDDYLVKPFAFTELLARVQALIRRANGRLESTHLSVGDLSIDLLTREIMRGNKKIELQPLDFALLEYLMRNAGRVVSKTMIMEHVWNYNFDPMTNVVEVRICRLRERVDKGFAQKLIHTVYGAGYVIKEDT